MNNKSISILNISRGSRITHILLPFVILIWILCGCGEEQVIMLEEIDNKTDAIEVEGITSEETGRDSVTLSDERKIPDPKETEKEKNAIVVYVCGCVKNEGVYELNTGSRVNDAIDAAGGFNENASKNCINLSAKLNDEDMIYIQSLEEATELEENGKISVEAGVTHGSANGITGKNAHDERININTANASELMSLKGIGESKASAIIEYREKNGSFDSIEDIMKVSGIGEGYFNKIKDYIRVK